MDPFQTALQALTDCGRGEMTGKSDTREYTINLHKALHKRHLTFKKRAPRAVKVIQEFAKKVVSGQAAEPRLLVVWDVLARRTRRAAPAAGRRRWAGGAQGEARPLASRRRAPRRPSSTSLSTGPSGRTASRLSPCACGSASPSGGARTRTRRRSTTRSRRWPRSRSSRAWAWWWSTTRRTERSEATHCLPCCLSFRGDDGGMDGG